MPEPQTERAWQVLHGVLKDVDFGPEPPDRVIGAWVENEATICIIFEKDGSPTMGLRRELESHLPVETLAGYIACEELGEPLGSLWDEAVVDDNGVHWVTGDHPEWRDYSWLMPQKARDDLAAATPDADWRPKQD